MRTHGGAARKNAQTGANFAVRSRPHGSSLMTFGAGQAAFRLS